MKARLVPPVLPALLVLLLAGGCIATASPRFPPDVAAAIADKPMRRLETEDIAVYYPEARRDEAVRFAGWVGGCVRDLRRWTPLDNVMSRRKPFVIIPEQAINNAFVMGPALGYEAASVVTSHSTFDFLVELGMPPDPALFGCHEMVHWVHMMQIGGFFWFIDLVFGDIITPQVGLDPWFHEGLATLYESRLQDGQGRIASPFWEGAFHAGVAGHRINGGDLSFAQRKFAFSNHYLVGSRFVDFLLQRYGEEQLWEIVRKQGTSFFFPLWVNLRFWQVYDKTLSTLIDEFADHVEQRYPVVSRPANQRSVRPLGHTARYASAANGTEATIDEGFDEPIRLEVHAPDGRLLEQRSLRELVWPRTLVDASSTAVSGLSLTADGAQVFFSLIDQGPVHSRVRLVRYDVPSDELTIVHEDLGGPGGGITADGRAYLFARARGERHELCELQLDSGAIRTLASEPGVFYGSPRPSPDGKRLVATAATGNFTRLVLLDRATGRASGPTGTLGSNGGAVDPAWLDDKRVTYVDKVGGRFQVFVHDTTQAKPMQLSQAPYLALAPRPAPGGKLRFLNREGWTWTLDEITLPSAPSQNRVATAPAPSDGVLLAVAAPAPAEAPAAPVIPPAAPVTVLEDEPYSQLDHLFTPQLRGISFAAGTNDVLTAGLSLAGGDRLSFHRWAITGAVDASHENDPKFGFGFNYANSQLAPVTLLLAANQQTWWGEQEVWAGPEAERPDIERRERNLGVAALLPFFTHAASLAAHYTEQRRYGDPDVPNRRRLGGASAGLVLMAIEPAPYVGVRRGLALALDGSLYPDQLSSESFSFADLRGELGTRLTVPPTSRLTFGIDLRGRTLAGAPAGSNLLELGGVGTFGNIYRRSTKPLSEPANEAFDVLPQRFVEPLRGYEDYALALDRLAMVDARLTYPIIFDRGFASSLVILPSFFVRQLEFEAWGAGATDTRGWANQNLHAAAGGSVTLRTVFWMAPLSLQYQIGKRLYDDKALVHLVGIGN